jgi:4-hydroxy-tetrahydrodipicolinate reductase
MGRELIRAVNRDEECSLIGGVVKSQDFIGNDLGDVASIKKIGVVASCRIEDVIDFADVVIDFSSPEGSINFAQIASAYAKPYVTGVTGYTPEQMHQLKSFSLNSAIFHSGNMSLGVQVLIKLAKLAAQHMPDCDVDLLDVHHSKKIDSPSGTARMIIDSLHQELGSDKIIVNSIRTGDFFGEHHIRFAGGFESLTISHQAQSRSIFAHGALKAAKWLVHKTKGFYTMQEMLT